MSEPIKNCRTCAHRAGGVMSGLGYCELTGFHCESQRRYPEPPCDENLSGWTPRPPRRSLRKWLYDLLLA